MEKVVYNLTTGFYTFMMAKNQTDEIQTSCFTLFLR